MRNLTLWIVIFALAILGFIAYKQSRTARDEISYTEFLDAVEQGEISEISLKGKEITGEWDASRAQSEHKEFITYSVPEDPDFVKLVRAKNVNLTVKSEDDSLFMSILISWFPFVIFFGLWLFIMRQMQGGGSKALSFGKSRAKLLSDDHQKVVFDDVAGADEAKEELSEIIEFLRDPRKFQTLGGKIPKGVLVVGPPGTGKTLLARAVAGEADVPFYNISGSEFVEMFVGVGASRVRDLFETGKKNAPCLIFIDEIDAVGRHRGAGLGGGHDEREQTLNQLLVEMDGFEGNDGVILIAATNRPDVLDPALLRPGRFDRQIVVARPDVRGREGILEVHTTKIPLADDVDLSLIARGTPGFSGADLANLVNEAALLAARHDQSVVMRKDLEEAKDKVMMGAERRSLIITQEEKKITAIHEAGHALIGKLLPGSDPVHKVTIIPRGRALGLTHYLPAEERYTYSKSYCENIICRLLAGRVAEEIFVGDYTNGAGDDLEKATELSRKMVCEWGMSEKMGPLTFGKKEEHIFLGREMAQHQDYSENTAIEIDNEIRRIVTECYEKTRKLLEENRDNLKKLSDELLEREVLDGEEVDQILGLAPAAPKTDSVKETKRGQSRTMKETTDSQEKNDGQIPVEDPAPA